MQEATMLLDKDKKSCILICQFLSKLQKNSKASTDTMFVKEIIFKQVRCPTIELKSEIFSMIIPIEREYKIIRTSNENTSENMTFFTIF